LIGFEITGFGFDANVPKFKAVISSRPGQGRMDIMNKDRQHYDTYSKLESTVQGLAN
jgi:hypothetical protein